MLTRVLFTILSASIASATFAEEVTETISAPASTEYCVEQTSVRGDYDNFIIDHNLVVSPEDVFEPGDVYVGVRFKSRPGEIWLLSKEHGWRKINSDADLASAQFAEYEQLQLVIPVSAFYEPTNISAAIGEGEIWVGYGLRGEDGTPKDSFEEMVENRRYSLIWQSPLSPDDMPKSGVPNASTTLCFDTTEVTKRYDTIIARIPSGEVTEERWVDIDPPMVTIPPGEVIEGPAVNLDMPMVRIPSGEVTEAPPIEE